MKLTSYHIIPDILSHWTQIFHNRQTDTCPAPAPQPLHRAVDLGQAATDRNLRAASHHARVAAALQRSPWLVMDAFVAQEGHQVMLALMNVAPGDRHFHDCVPASLGVLRMVTLHPAAREATSAAVLTVGPGRYRSPPHRMPCNSGNEDANYIG